MSKELSFTLTVKQNSGELEHELDVQVNGCTKADTQDIQDIINDDVDFITEDLRRRVTRLLRNTND